MHCNIPYLFDFWADLFVNLLLLKSSMFKPTQLNFFQRKSNINKIIITYGSN